MDRNIKQIRKGEVYYADLFGTAGSEQDGVRPVLIIQNDVGNRNSTTTIIAPLTTKKGKIVLPTHVTLKKQSGLSEDSVVLLEQIRTIDKARLLNFVCVLDGQQMQKVDKAIMVSFGIGGDFQ